MPPFPGFQAVGRSHGRSACSGRARRIQALPSRARARVRSGHWQSCLPPSGHLACQTSCGHEGGRQQRGALHQTLTPACCSAAGVGSWGVGVPETQRGRKPTSWADGRASQRSGRNALGRNHPPTSWRDLGTGLKRCQVTGQRHWTRRQSRAPLAHLRALARPWASKDKDNFLGPQGPPSIDSSGGSLFGRYTVVGLGQAWASAWLETGSHRVRPRWSEKNVQDFPHLAVGHGGGHASLSEVCAHRLLHGEVMGMPHGWLLGRLGSRPRDGGECTAHLAEAIQKRGGSNCTPCFRGQPVCEAAEYTELAQATGSVHTQLPAHVCGNARNLALRMKCQ